MIYRFADISIDSETRQVRRDDQLIGLSKLGFDVLLALVEAAPKVLDHDGLTDRAWGRNRVVTPENQLQRIMLVRKSLGDDAQNPRYIEVVRGQGFRLIPEVISTDPVEEIQPLPQPGVKEKKHRRSYMAVAFAVVILAGLFFTAERFWLEPGESAPLSSLPKSLAVLPFANLSPDPDNAYYAAGIHEEILNALAKLKELKVISRTSMGQYAGTQLSIKEIASQLDVDSIIEGSVRYANDRIRVTVQLVDGSTDHHIWSETYDRGFGDIFEIETDIAEKVAEVLQITYGDDERSLIKQAPTTSPEAFAQYLRGQDALAQQIYQSGKQFAASADIYEAVPFAAEQFERAVARDPEFALAHAALSVAHIDMYWYGFDGTDERRQKAWASAQRARELQPGLPEARFAMAMYFYHGYRDYNAALHELDAIRDQMRSNSELHNIYGSIYKRTNRWDESVVSLRKATELDPRNFNVLWNFGYVLAAMRRFDEAREIADRALSLAPEMGALYSMRAFAELWESGNTQVAGDLAHSAKNELGERAASLAWWHALYSRDYDSALVIVEAEDQFRFPHGHGLWPTQSMRATIHSLRGDQELALKYFEIAREQIVSRMEENPGSAYLKVALGEALVGLGETQLGIEITEQALAEFSPLVDSYYSRLLQYEAIVRIFLIADPFGRALAQLDDYLSNHGGGFTIEGLLPDPRFDVVRTEPQFLQIVEKFKRRD